MLFEFQNYLVLINASWICLRVVLDLSDMCWLSKDLSDTDLDLLKTVIDSFPVNILLVFKTTGRKPEHILKLS